jgi:hypothetical protein
VNTNFKALSKSGSSRLSMENKRIQLLRLLAGRLERLSVDSHWARRAGGLRGNIIKALEEADAGERITAARLDLLTERAFEVLRRAGEEIPDPDLAPGRKDGSK